MLRDIKAYDEIYLIGVEFSREEKNIVGHEVESL